ncbi:hypothetical protein QVD17_24286 [Tagetes erecta]|uniref:Uncharacterized protein n=1 Tax=Tagetes erecta TaxID=13708 RepID=A0AAD8KFA2_TARER|nr:hypothetical protein QVD17_24286 [Tagetes erecta]
MDNPNFVKPHVKSPLVPMQKTTDYSPKNTFNEGTGGPSLKGGGSYNGCSSISNDHLFRKRPRRRSPGFLVALILAQPNLSLYLTDGPHNQLFHPISFLRASSALDTHIKSQMPLDFFDKSSEQRVLEEGEIPMGHDNDVLDIPSEENPLETETAATIQIGYKVGLGDLSGMAPHIQKIIEGEVSSTVFQ